MTGEVIYFISDTHLGDGTGADRFRYPRQLMELLARIESQPHAQLVLLGDIMELWACSLESVLVRHAPFFQAVGRIAATRPVIYVVGNHDCLPWYYFVGSSAGSLQMTERFRAAGGNLVALHGHQFDPFNRVTVALDGHVKVPWTRKLVEVVGFLGRIGGPKAGNAIDDLSDVVSRAAASLEQLLPDWDAASRRNMRGLLKSAHGILQHESPGERGYPSEERIYEEGARALLSTGTRFVALGHTHHPLVRAFPEGVYVNTGCWVWDRYPPTYGRYADGRLELYEANTHQPYRPPAAANK